MLIISIQTAHHYTEDHKSQFAFHKNVSSHVGVVTTSFYVVSYLYSSYYCSSPINKRFLPIVEEGKTFSAPRGIPDIAAVMWTTAERTTGRE
jgi:hypothetical protein